MQIVFNIIMFILGACVGSFLCCTVRRMRRKELGEKKLGKWSVCPACGEKLKWYENIPIVSWCVQKGKCRKCGARIGYLEIFSEVATALIFLGLATTAHVYLMGALEWVAFVVVVIFSCILIYMAMYDGMYGELPVLCLILAAVAGVIYVAIEAVIGEMILTDVVISVAILGGLYLILYLVSKGKWVGDGDWALAGAIGLVLGQPLAALVALFIANFSACIVMWPEVKKTKNHKIYFGPFLVFAFVVTFIFTKCVIINL